MVTAHLLGRDHELTVFEANDYVGGHTNTIEVDFEGRLYPVDTGFIVFNERNYPNFTKLIRQLGVASQASDMSFSVREETTGLEWAGTTFNSLFAQRRNLLRPSFYRFLLDIKRFNEQSKALLEDGNSRVTLGEYLEAGGYSRELIEHYVIPMGSAIWSAAPEMMKRFPARTFVQFFENHGFLDVYNMPQWRTIRGGSQRYVEALTASFRDGIRLECPVRRLRRLPDGVEVVSNGGQPERFDRVVIATHSDQALALLEDPSDAEREILSAIPYQVNDTVLHTDDRLLPRTRRARASWNALIPRDPVERVTLTYDMNRLQSIDAPVTFCVTLNRTAEIRPEKILRRITYHHPVFTLDTIDAQKRLREINGVNRTYFAGAYWGHGFHEDGVRSGLAVCELFGMGL